MLTTENFFQLLTDNAVVGVYAVDEEGLFNYVNSALASLLGYRAEELIGSVSFFSVIHPDEIPLLENCFEQCLGGVVTTVHLETRAFHKSGCVVSIEIFATCIDASGQRLLAGTATDITARRTAEKLLIEHQQALEALNLTLEQRITDALAVCREKERMVIQQSRFAAMGEMVAGISHQWRQPLNMLGMSIQALQLAKKKGILTDDFMGFHCEKSLDVLKFMSQTIDDFRSFFHPEKAPHYFRLDDAVEKIVVFFASNVLDVAITTDARCRATVCGHVNELSQVILNLLNNARDTLLERHVADPAIFVSVTRDNNMNIIKVEDNAGGIPEHIINRVFDPFFSTKEASSGTGLGLYMVKSIVEKGMKGAVSVKNLDAGAEFSITLP